MGAAHANGTAARTTLDQAAIDFLLELHDTPAPSGFEAPAVEVFGRRARELGAEWSVDATGNGVATFNPGAGPRVMVTGHVDEIGFIVTHVGDGGMLRFQDIGGWDTTVPSGHRVQVITADGPCQGVIARSAVHVLGDDERGKAPRYRDMWIDCGFATDEEAAARVRVGDPVVLDAAPVLWDNRRFMSRSVDDRIGAFIALEGAARTIGANVEVVALAAVCEEITGHGARTGTGALAPLEALAIDVWTTSDVPGDHEDDFLLGEGPGITFGSVTGSRIGRELVDVARERGIPHQLLASGTHTSTDADEIARGGSGTPVGLINLPCRYLHSPGELCSLDDVEHTIDLVAAWLSRDRASA